MTEAELLQRLENDYTYHPLKDDQIARYQAIREKALKFAYFLVASTPQSREQSCALTHLEEVVAYANAAIARNEK
jgi:hypothetical protein